MVYQLFQLEKYEIFNQTDGAVVNFTIFFDFFV